MAEEDEQESIRVTVPSVDPATGCVVLDPEAKMIRHPTRCTMSKGAHTCTGPCRLIFRWNNAFSYFRSKYLSYYVLTEVNPDGAIPKFSLKSSPEKVKQAPAATDTATLEKDQQQEQQTSGPEGEISRVKVAGDEVSAAIKTK